MTRPSSSPDLNPIENLWSVLKWEIYWEKKTVYLDVHYLWLLLHKKLMVKKPGNCQSPWMEDRSLLLKRREKKGIILFYLFIYQMSKIFNKFWVVHIKFLPDKNKNVRWKDVCFSFSCVIILLNNIFPNTCASIDILLKESKPQLYFLQHSCLRFMHILD